ncbi:hypothetical protein, partial [Bacteroides xylanisolvens]|uniref:hypothetical protein n=1 Tax=Bacteroides xylanisolvens TaxID=371601 RepID=UPI0034A5BF94
INLILLSLCAYFAMIYLLIYIELTLFMCRPQDFMENPEIISLSNKLKQNKIPEGIPQNNRYKKGG